MDLSVIEPVYPLIGLVVGVKLYERDDEWKIIGYLILVISGGWLLSFEN